MDEGRISALFGAAAREAVRDAPPAGFDREGVVAESARLTRRRNAVVAGSALAFALLAGGVVAGTALRGESPVETASAASAPVAPGNETLAPYEVPDEAPEARTDQSAASAESHPPPTPMQGGADGGDAGREAGGTPGGCGTAVREFAAALAGELPAATSAGQPVPAPLTCPPGARAAAVPVADGPRRGLLSLMVAPKGAALPMPPWHDRPSGTVGAVAIADSGAHVVVVIEPVAGSAAPPLDVADARGIADRLKRRY